MSNTPKPEQDELNCPECNEPMENLGNLSGVVMASNPPQWDVTYVCRADKLKKVVRKHGTMNFPEDLSGYKVLL